MKKTFALSMLALASSVAFANGKEGTQPTSAHAGQQQQQQQQTTTTSIAGASNEGNSQSVNFGPGAIAIQVGPTEQARDTTSRQITDAVIEQRGDTTQRIIYSGSQTVKNVPSVSGPPLVSSNDTCMGSTSGSVNIPGFGAGLGTTWTDKNCVMLKNSRELWNMGMKGAALALMCNDSLNREALELTGFECPQTARARQQPVPVADAQYTDPIVRARLGLPPLAQ